MQPKLTRVTVRRESDEKYYHIVAYRVFMDGEAETLCRVKPFPERWTEGKGDGLRACPTCVARLR